MATKTKAKPKPKRSSEEEIQHKRGLIRLIGAKKASQLRMKYAVEYHCDTRGRPLNFDYRHYLLQIYADPAPDIVLRVPVQIGKTEWQVCDSLACSSLGMTVFCVQPKFELRGVHVHERYDKLIAASPKYKEIMGGTSSDSTTLKHFGRGTLRFVGSRVESDMISFPADVLELDEVDRCDLDILILAEDRLEESDYKMTRRTSTPTIPGSAAHRNIDHYYQLSDQKRWYVPCPECGYEQELRWDVHLLELVRDEEGRILQSKLLDKDWTEGKWKRTGQKISLPCSECHKPLNRLARGRWVSTNPRANKISGYTMSRLIAVTSEVEKIWLSFEQALGSPSAMQRVINSLFGEPYSGVGDRLTEELLNRATTILPVYASPVTPVGQCSMGVDVNRPFFDVWISDYPSVPNPDEAVRRLVWAGRVLQESDLHDLVAKYNVRTCVIDAEPEVRLSLRFQQEAKCEVWRCKFRHTEGTFTNDWRKDDKNGLIEVDRTSSLDHTLQSFMRDQVALPINWKSLCNGDFQKMILDAVRILTRDNGIDRYIWVGDHAHTLHTCNYDFLAFRLGGFIPLGAGFNGTATAHRRSSTSELLDEYDRFHESSLTQGIDDGEDGKRL